MHIMLNGTTKKLDLPHSLAEFLAKHGITPSTGGIAVAYNEEIAFRKDWDSFIVKDGDRIEIIHAVQGG